MMSLREELSQIVRHYDPKLDQLSFMECMNMLADLKHLVALAEGEINSRRPRPPAPTSGPYAPGQNTQSFHSQIREKRGY
jgi:hypothetical protein